MYLIRTGRFIFVTVMITLTTSVQAEELCRLQSPDGFNAMSVSLTEEGRLFYHTEHRGQTLIADSPLGLRCHDEDFTKQMTLHKIGLQRLRREQYQLIVGNHLSVDSTLTTQSLTLTNAEGDFVRLDLVASNEGVGFRYVFEGNDLPRTVTEEITGFQVPQNAEGWMQPYHAAGPYTPAYEDFYYHLSPGEKPPVFRAQPRGWCLPGLFHLEKADAWILIAESDVDEGYCAGHLEEEPSSKGLYQIAFAYADEVTEAKQFDVNAKPASVSARKTPWRVIVMGDKASDILNSTFVTDLARPSQIQDTSWIKPGRASWSWWSHPDGPDTTEFYNSYTDLAADFGWEYMLFDAGWWKADIQSMCRYANERNILPLAWTGAGDFLSKQRRTRKLDEMIRNGVKGVKVDFWCSDRQETMAAMQGLLKDAAERKLVVVLHGCTIPRGWHRTWPNLLTAEAVLGVESYFYESRYPARTAEQNTILPFTRNVLAPMDTTPVGLTIRKYPRKTSAVHELAAALVFNSGIIHYADSVEAYRGLPDDVKQVIKDAPAAWDETVCLVGEPGEKVVTARRTDKQWFIAGLNGTDHPVLVSLDLKSFGRLAGVAEITEGKDPLMQFSIRSMSHMAIWEHRIPPFGGFVLKLSVAE